MCDVLLEREMIQELLPYFAEMSGSQSVTYNHFQRWVNNECADELVLAVTARKLRMLISVIPKDASWLVRTHPDVSFHGDLGIDEKSYSTAVCQSRFHSPSHLRAIYVYSLGIVIVLESAVLDSEK
jgi:hypothetical protein